MKTGVVDVGGGLRGVYAAGIFDYCLDHEITFDLCIGVSAGSANIASFLAGQKKRNYTFYTEYSLRKEYMSLQNFLRRRSYIDLDYIYGTLSNAGGENPLDYSAIIRNPSEMMVVATEAESGKARYFSKNDLKQDCYDIFKASSAIPWICQPYKVQGIPYYDGALGDAVPVKKALDSGCDKVVLILTKPKDLRRTAGLDNKFADRIQRCYPAAADALRQRAERYNRDVKLAKKYEAEGVVRIIAPDDTCGVKTLTRNRNALRQFYEKGYHDAETISSF